MFSEIPVLFTYLGYCFFFFLYLNFIFIYFTTAGVMVRRWTMDYVHERAHKDRSISVWECSDWTVCNAPLLCWFHMHADAACLTEQTLWWSCTGSVWQQELAGAGKRRILCPTDARWHDLWADTDQTHHLKRHTVTAHSEAEQLFQVFSLLRWAKRWCLCVCRN